MCMCHAYMAPHVLTYILSICQKPKRIKLCV